MNTQTIEFTPEQISDVGKRAAANIREFGWQTGNLGTCDGPKCALGAVAHVTCGIEAVNGSFVPSTLIHYGNGLTTNRELTVDEHLYNAVIDKLEKDMIAQGIKKAECTIDTIWEFNDRYKSSEETVEERQQRVLNFLDNL